MNNSNSNKQKKIICDCTGTTEAKIEALIAKGKNTLDEISSATGAGTGCGSCDILIIELLDKVKT